VPGTGPGLPGQGLGSIVDLTSLGRLGGPNVWPNQGFGLPGVGMRWMPSFTVHSVAVVTPTIDPLAQLRQQFDPFSQVGMGLGQAWQPWQQGLGSRLVRTHILTAMGVIPVDMFF
jgi:hypothetical protein